MKLRYATTPLEDWVTDLYRRIGICKPSDIHIETIAERCGIIVVYEPVKSHFIVHECIRFIILDSRLSAEKQREIFFHELCHILRHVGMQGIMPAAFREMQEWDAEHFTTYAAIPYHMLQYIRLDRDVIAHMTEVFRVTPTLCTKRLLQIQNRIQAKECV